MQDPDSGGGPEAAEPAVEDVHQAVRIPPACGPGGDAEPLPTGSRGRLHEFSLMVPFRSPLEANIARGSLAPDAEPHHGLVVKELAVQGSSLIVRWTADDSRLLRISIISFLDQLCLVVRTMLRFGPPVSR